MKTLLLYLIILASLSIVSEKVVAQTLWLDKPLKNWNHVGSVVPTAARANVRNLRECARTLRPATVKVDSVLSQRGWKLVGAVQLLGNVSVVTATSDFGAMCRRKQFQAFVFVGPKFAGTLSPTLMDSRKDGSLLDVVLRSNMEMEAVYARYTEDDPLCCPSKTERVYFRLKRERTDFIVRPYAK